MLAAGNRRHDREPFMQIYREPTVYLLAQTQFHAETLQKFLAAHQIEWQPDSDADAEQLAETAGRVCYMSFARPRPGGTKAYLDHVLDVGHFSVVEHPSWTFLIEHVSRSLTHELVRHRIASISQLSQRYVDESTAEYVVPDIIADDPELFTIWKEVVEYSHQGYCELAARLYEKLSHVEDRTARRKQARQAARSVLPNATETKLVWTVNTRALRHFFDMRASRHADVEIRKLANQLYQMTVKGAPDLFADYTVVPLEDGTFELVSSKRDRG